MEVSTFTASPEYSTGFWCNLCKTKYEAGTARWFCQICEYDVCFSCSPEQKEVPKGDEESRGEEIDHGFHLAACLDVFREPLGQTIEAKVFAVQTVREKLEPLLEKRAKFLAPHRARLEAFLERLAEISASLQESSEHMKDLNQEMVQEQEQQQQQQRHRVRETEQVRKFAPDLAGGGRWPLSCLEKPSTSKEYFYPLSAFQFDQNAPWMPFPSEVLLSENHTPKYSRSDLPRCLKDVHIVFLWVQEAHTQVVIVNLQEAESLRHAYFQQEGLRQRIAIRTLSGVWLTPALAKPVDEQTQQLHFACIRFFNNNTLFTNEETIHLLRILRSLPQSRRRAFFETTLLGRRRTRVSWQGTPVGRVFAYPDETRLIALQGLTEKIQGVLRAKHASLIEAFHAFDSNHDGWVSPAELAAGLSSLSEELQPAEISAFVNHINSECSTHYLNLQTFVTAFSDPSRPSEEALPVISDPLLSSGSAQTVSSLGTEFVEGLEKLGTPSAQVASRKTAAPTSSVLSLQARVKSLKSLGRLALVNGGAAKFSVDGVVTTRGGMLPSVGFQGVGLTHGRYYYEVTIIQAGRGSVGWADMMYHGGSDDAKGVGDDAHSWGYRGHQGRLKHHGLYLGEPVQRLIWSAGDVVCCAIDLTNKVMRFAINGDWKPSRTLELRDFVFSTAVSPMVSFESEMVFQMNSGQTPFRYPMPPHFRSVHHWIRRRMREIYVSESGSRLGTLVPQGLAREVIIDQWRLAPNIVGRQTVFPTVRLDGVLLTEGRWYYEVTVKDSGVAQIGWFDLDFWASSKEGVGVGDDKSSWAYDGARCLKWFQVQVQWGLSTPWTSEEVVGVACDVTERTLRFSRNGSWSSPMGLAFANINFSGGLTPGITIQGHPEHSFSCVLNFGDDLVNRPFAFAPPGEGYKPVWHAVLEGQVVLGSLSLDQTNQSLLSAVDFMTPLHEGGGSTSSLTSSTSTVSFAEASSLGLAVTSGYPYVLITDNVVTASEYYPSLIGNRCRVWGGKWYYEIRVFNVSEVDPPQEPLFSIGWAQKGFFGDAIGYQGVGDDRYSVGIDNLTRIRHHGRVSHAVDQPIKRRDVIGVMADPKAGKLTFLRNGQFLAEATLSTPSPVFPAFSLRSSPKGTVTALHFNFGETPFLFPPPEDYRPLHDWFESVAARLLSSPSPKLLSASASASRSSAPLPSGPELPNILSADWTESRASPVFLFSPQLPARKTLSGSFSTSEVSLSVFGKGEENSK